MAVLAKAVLELLPPFSVFFSRPFSPPKKGAQKRLQKPAFPARLGTYDYSPKYGPFLES
jgi:hypothetical protein